MPLRRDSDSSRISRSVVEGLPPQILHAPAQGDRPSGSQPPSGSQSKLDSTPSQPSAASSAEYIVSGLMRHRRFVALAFAIVAILTAGIIYLTFREKPLESLAVLPFVNVGGNA